MSPSGQECGYSLGTFTENLASGEKHLRSLASSPQVLSKGKKKKKEHVPEPTEFHERLHQHHLAFVQV